MIEIPSSVMTQMQDHAFAWYPGECCGLLFAKTGDVASRAVCVDNLADKYHQLDPKEFPRTARDAFKMNEAKVGKLVAEAKLQGERWLSVFHSHIDCDAYFSGEDIFMAAPTGVPNEPELWHVVMACYGTGAKAGEIRIARAFKWDGKEFAGRDLPGFARKHPGKKP